MTPRFLALFLFIGLLLVPASAFAQAAPCQYILGFATLHDMAPADIGDCLNNQAFASNGDAQQTTSKGLMAWRKADNWTAFTNGYQTWLNGPGGLVKRLNTERFPWEGDSGAAGTTLVAGLKIVCTDGFIWPNLTRQGACSTHKGIAPGY